MECLRRVIHIGSVCLAALFAFPWFAPWMALIVSGGALTFNLLLLPRLGGGFYRAGESRYRGGVVFYPLSVTLLIIVFWIGLGRPDVAAAGWAVMAAGDGGATLVGKSLGKRRLPWNRAKSWAGLFGFIVLGIPVTALLLWLVSHRGGEALSIGTAFRAAASAVIPCAILESLSLRVDDNLLVPFVGALLVLLGT